MLVSVLMPTYNHEKCIGQALESILFQRRNFDLEVLIGDDSSQDRTVEIVSEYYKKRPDILKPIFRSENIGFKNNYIDLFFRCKGKYIAVLSGDDYWIDPYKLQKQVDFLEENPDYVLVGHNSIVLHDELSTPAILSNQTKTSTDVSTRDLMENNPFSASEVMFRNFLIKEFPPIYYESTGEDRRLYILLSQFGKCRFDLDVTGVYRIHPGSITTRRVASYRSKLELIEESIRNVRAWNNYLKGEYGNEENRVIGKCSRQIVELALKNQDIKTAIKYSVTARVEKNDSRKKLYVILLLKFIAQLLNTIP